MNRNNPFSTDEAIAGQWDPDNGFGHYIVKNDYEDHPLHDEDNELASLSVRLRDYQDSAITIVAENIGYYVTGVCRTAWMRGIDVLDDEIQTDMWKCSREVKNAVQWVIKSNPYDGIESGQYEDIVSLPNVSDPYNKRKGISGVGDVDKVYNFGVLPAQKSRINTTFKKVMNFGGWFHRALIDMGMSGFSRIPPTNREIFDSAAEVIPEIVAEQVRQPIDIMIDYFVECTGYWAENKVHGGFLSDVELIADSFDVRPKHILLSEIDRMRDSSDYEIVWPDDGSYVRITETEHINVGL